MRWSDAGLAALGYPSPDRDYRMPDLSALFDNNMANVSLDRVGGTFRGPTQYPSFNMWMNVVRLTDLAIRDYESARGHLAEYRRRARFGRVSPYYEALNSLEEVVVATYRAVLNCERLQTQQGRRLRQPTGRQRKQLKIDEKSHTTHGREA